MFSHLAPAGTPVTATDLAAGLAAALRPGETLATLSASLGRLAGTARAWPMSSGRAAMVVILRALRNAAKDPRRDEVLIPGYTCYSVPAAVELAGLRPRLCDVDPETLALDPDALHRAELGRVLAVCSSNLYGIPNELPALEAFCAGHGIWLLDDAAQALGATIAGRPVGSFGAAGLYSFDKGKVISTMQGGAIVARDGPVADALASIVESLPPTRAVEALGLHARLLAYAALLRPLPYGLVTRLPGTGLGQTPYETDYPIARLAPMQAGVAVSLLRRLGQLAAGRTRLASRLASALAGLPGVGGVRVPAQSVPSWTRFPLRIVGPRQREAAVEALVRAGIGATRSYPCALVDVPEVAARRAGTEHTPGARAVAASIVTLPTHAYCPPDYPDRVRATLLAVLGGPTAVATEARP